MDPRGRNKVSAKITTPWNYQFDFKMDRSFYLGKFPLTAFIYVQNVFNHKNVQHVYWRTGVTSTDGSFGISSGTREFLESLGEEFILLYEQINIGHRQEYQWSQGGDLFGRPREIRFGLQIGFGTSL